MKQTPCEYMLWNGLPVIRKEIAESMIQRHGLTQKEAAEKLGITPAAVCQYLSHKRGKIKITDPLVLEEIHRSAERIIQNTEVSIVSETCRICKTLIAKKIFPIECGSCPPEE
ncbi:MAG: Fis family transcriptional regulator [Candidatus Thermoplasmatota archaeon]